MSEKIPSTSGKHFQYLPSDWKLDRLEKIVSQKITYGIVQPGKFDSSGIPLIRGVDYMSGWNNLNSFFRVSKNLHQKFKRSTTRKGDVLLSIAGYAGYVSVVPEWIEEANITQTTARISIEENSMSPHFVAYFLDSIEGKLQSRRYIKGSAQEGLNLDDVQKFFIPIPPLPEQKKITTILKSVDRVIENTQKQIDKLQDLKKATMNELLTKGIGHTEFKDSELGKIPKSWEVKPLGKVSNKIGSGVTPRGGASVYQTRGVILIRSQNIHFDGLKLKGVAHISEEIHAGMKGSIVHGGDVLLNITGASIGRCSVVPENFAEANVNQHVCIIRTTDELHNKFLNMWLSSDYGQDQIMRFQAGGNREGLNFQQIRSIQVPVPHLDEQERSGKIIDSIQTSINEVQLKLNQTQSLKKSLMQDLLTGKVRVQVN